MGGGVSGLVFEGRVLVDGHAAGEILVCTRAISGWGGIDPRTGTIVETGHPQRGRSLAGRIIVIPGAKGSSGWSGQFHLAKLLGTAPAGIISDKVNSKLALGLAVLGVPALTDMPNGMLSAIADGDLAEIDRNRFTVQPQAAHRQSGAS